MTRIRAPELTGRAWLNTGGRRLRIADLRGRFCIIDFWTSCCINCLHVLEELRPLEAKYAEVLVVVGVHSPKFAHEADPAALRAAVDRYAVHHPVLDDPELTTWQAYTARAWPTLTLIDPEGYIVAQFAGEGHGHALDSLLGELVPAHDSRATLYRSASPYVPSATPQTPLRFPGKVVRLDQGRMLVADTAGQSLALLRPDLTTVVRRIGTGERGLFDGGPARARFRDPNGMCVMPHEIASRVGYSVIVADTVNHALRALRVRAGDVRTLVGSGHQWRQGDGTAALSSPWDVAWYQGTLWIAMAGVHQLWTFDPVTGAVEVAAGTGNEGLEDGTLEQAWFAQPSALAVSQDGSRLWVADAETSALRVVENGQVRTVIGSGLFDFGFRDGPAEEALLQHPLGLCVLPDDSVAICDTYNGAVRRYDPETDTVTTLVGDLAEPTDAVVDDDDLVVVESAAHRLVRFPRSELVGREVKGPTYTTSRPVTELTAGEIELTVVFEVPVGQKLDDSEGAPTRLYVRATPPALLAEGEGTGDQLSRRLVLDPAVGNGVLHIAATAATCDLDTIHPACNIHQQDWGVPVRLKAGASNRLTLILGGLVED